MAQKKAHEEQEEEKKKAKEEKKRKRKQEELKASRIRSSMSPAEVITEEKKARDEKINEKIETICKKIEFESVPPFVRKQREV